MKNYVLNCCKIKVLLLSQSDVSLDLEIKWRNRQYFLLLLLLGIFFHVTNYEWTIISEETMHTFFLNRTFSSHSVLIRQFSMLTVTC
jgi:hypothetical protein